MTQRNLQRLIQDYSHITTPQQSRTLQHLTNDGLEGNCVKLIVQDWTGTTENLQNHGHEFGDHLNGITNIYQK